ncbi:hypothetical protein F4553_005273 [Allocatelliglobosispora scoriae]|uniref:Uncharacterized protein n=1 Tax=Allocatelliglobosispora scoriae TaxID=643052 RepID=A0A841BUL7_9ACTN|nr:hypothetical protein [Allocatelliglobosispora scoriae]
MSYQAKRVPEEGDNKDPIIVHAKTKVMALTRAATVRTIIVEGVRQIDGHWFV